MRITSIRNMPFVRKAILAGATVAGTLGVGATLTSCADTPIKYGYPYEEFQNNSPYNSELIAQSDAWIRQDPDAQGECTGHRLNVGKDDASFVCTQGDTIIYYPLSGTKEIRPANGGEPGTQLLEDVAAGISKRNYN